MRAIVGLGNPGPRYRDTRHNVGWMVLDSLALRWLGGGSGAGPSGGRARLGAASKPVSARHAEILRTEFRGLPVMLVKPQTFMNESGLTVRALVEKDGFDPQDILVIYDDLDLAAGKIRLREQGSSGGHRGIRSIQEHLAKIRLADRQQEGRDPRDESDRPETASAGKSAGVVWPAFPRLKIGIGRPPGGVDPVDFVLTPFSPDERTVIEPAIVRAADSVESWLDEGTAVTMNRFNGT